MQIRQLQPKNLNTQTVERLGQRVVRSHYGEGQQLPIEPEPCVEFAVGRTLRNALTISIRPTSWHEEIHVLSLPRHTRRFTRRLRSRILSRPTRR